MKQCRRSLTAFLFVAAMFAASRAWSATGITILPNPMPTVLIGQSITLSIDLIEPFPDETILSVQWILNDTFSRFGLTYHYAPTRPGIDFILVMVTTNRGTYHREVSITTILDQNAQQTWPSSVIVSEGTVGTTLDASINRVQNNRVPLTPDLATYTFLGTPVPITLEGTDPDNDPMTFSIFINPRFGTLSEDPAFPNNPMRKIYVPNAGFAGDDYFAYQVMDNRGAMKPAIVKIRMPGATSDLSPTINSDILTTAYQTQLNVTVTAASADGNSMALEMIVPPGGHSDTPFVLGPTQFGYRPNDYFFGVDYVIVKTVEQTPIGKWALGIVKVTVSDPPIDSAILYYGNKIQVAALSGYGAHVFNVSSVPSGVQNFELVARDRAGMTSTTRATLRVDHNPPECRYTDHPGRGTGRVEYVRGLVSMAVEAIDAEASSPDDDNINVVSLLQPAPGGTYVHVNGQVGAYQLNDFATSGVVADGLVQFRTICVDRANNQSAPASFNLRIDNTPPVVALAVVQAGEGSINEAALLGSVLAGSPIAVRGELDISIIATDLGAGRKSVSLYRSDVSPANLLRSWSDNRTAPFTHKQLFGEGTLKLIAVAEDNVGNTTTIDRTYIVDNEPPLINFQFPTDGMELDAPLSQLQVGVTDTGGVQSVAFYIDTLAVSPTLTSPNVYALATPVSAAGQHTLRIVTQDTLGNQRDQTISFEILSTNQAPIASNFSTDTPEDTAKSITLPATDNEDDDLTYAIVSGPSNGTLSGEGGVRTYTPHPNFHGDDSFTFRVNDGLHDSNTGKITIYVQSLNDAPVAESIPVPLSEDGSATFALPATDSENDTLTFIRLSEPLRGTLTQTGAQIIYTPHANYNGADQFTFKANDGTMDSNVGTISLVIAAVNDAPTAENISISTNEDEPVAITLIYGDVDGPTTVTTTLPSHGSLSAGPNRTYTPASNYAGPDSFQFTVTDSGGLTVTKTVSITVNPVNDVPSATAQNLQMDEDELIAIALSGTDADQDELVTTKLSDPSFGRLAGTIPNLTYIPNANFNGTDSFDFNVRDGHVDSAAARITITVRSVNDLPVATSQTVEMIPGELTSGILQAYDIDNPIVSYSVTRAPQFGSVQISGNSFAYTADANGSDDSFGFKANDGFGLSNEAVVSLIGKGANRAPVASNVSLPVVEDTSLTFDLQATDEEENPLTFVRLSEPQHGTVTQTGSQIIYTPHANYNGADQFTFKANDGIIDSNIATVSLSVTPVNDAPTAEDAILIVNEDASIAVSLVYSDVEGAPSVSVTAPSHGTLSAAPNRVYTPALNYAGPDNFQFTVTDSGGLTVTKTVSITVNPVNDAPSATAQNLQMNEDELLAIFLAGTDFDQDALTATTLSSPSNGRLEGTVPNLTYIPNANFNGTDSFDFKVRDSQADSVAARITITVRAVNDTPVATSQVVVVQPGVAKTITLQGQDLETPSPTFTITVAPARGQLTGTGAQRVYTPQPGFVGEDTAKFTVGDGVATSAEATVTFWVGSNDSGLSAIDQSISTQEDSSASILLTAEGSGSNFAYIVMEQPVHGTLSGQAPSLVYQPESNFHGVDAFSFRVTDNQNRSALGTITITVNPVNDAPTVEMISPLNNGWVGSSVQLRARASDDGSIASVTFKIGTGPELLATLETGLYRYQWQVPGQENQTHSIRVTAKDNNNVAVNQTISVRTDFSAPEVEILEPSAGETLSGIEEIIFAGSDSNRLSEVQVFIGTELVFSGQMAGTDQTLEYLLDTADIPNGTRQLQIRVEDVAGNQTVIERAVVIHNVDNPAQAPEFEIPLLVTEDQAVSGIFPLQLVVTDGSADSAQVRIDNNPPVGMTQVNPGLFRYDLNTTQLVQGLHTLLVTVTENGESTQRSFRIRVDNTAPVVSIQQPTAESAINMVTNLIARIEDGGHPLKNVTFRIGDRDIAFFNGHSDPTQLVYTYLFDPDQEDESGDRIYQDGQQLSLTVIARDAADNTNQLSVPFTINTSNPPISTGRLEMFPPHSSFVVGDEDSRITVRPVDVAVNRALLNENSFKVYFTRDGKEERIDGFALINGNDISFTGTVPKNTRVRVTASMVDTSGNLLRQNWQFTRGFATSDSIEAKSTDGRLSISLPAHSLPEPAFFEIVNVEDTTETLEQANQAAAGLINGEVYAGPYRAVPVNANGLPLLDLSAERPGMLRFNETVNPNNDLKQSYVFQPQFLETNSPIWRVLSTREGTPTSSSLPTIKSVSAAIVKLGVFRITSFPVPAPGITDLTNFPNPFSPNEGGTTIFYLLGEESDVTWTIYDLMGNLVLKREIPAGTRGGQLANEVHWNGRNGEGDEVANGGYILQVIAKGTSGSVHKSRHKLAVVK